MNRPLRAVLLTSDSREGLGDYVSRMPSFGTAPAALLQGLARLKEIEVHVVSCAQQPMDSPAKLAENVWFHSVHVPKIGWLRTGYQGCIRAVRRTMGEIRPDVVHGQGTERDCAISAVFSGFPNVVTVHGNMRLVAKVNRARPFSYEWLTARLERFTLPRADGVVCITRYTQEAVRRLARRTWLLPNAVDETYFDVVPQPAPPPTVICIGAVCPRKNQIRFIQALEPLAAQGALRLQIFGAAPAWSPYCVEFLGLVKERPWCVYEGLADRARLQTAMGQATLLALPSLEDNCPMVVLEAMAAGVPVLAAKVGGVPDLVEEGVNGLFCDPTDLSSLGAGVERLLNDPALRIALARCARQQARARFHPDQIARRHLEIYRAVVSTDS
jgi:glycosyltransferase involved in cell wall biosynthesis